MKLYKKLASLVYDMNNCEKYGNDEWLVKQKEKLEELAKEHMPSGSGFDSGTQFSIEESTPEKLVFHTEFHHMDEHGGYSGWTSHTVTVTPSLAFGYNLKVSGRDHKEIKAYIQEVFSAALDIDVD